MVEKIETIAKIYKTGNSLVITIKKDVQELLHLEEGDFIKLVIEKIEKSKEKEDL